MKRFLAAISVAILTLTGCAAEPEAAPEETVIEQAIDFGLQDAVIYEVNVRQFTPEGTFKAFQEHLPRIQELGV